MKPIFGLFRACVLSDSSRGSRLAWHGQLRYGVAAIILVIGLAGCSKGELLSIHDSDKMLTRETYQDVRQPPAETLNQLKAEPPPVPDLPEISAPTPQPSVNIDRIVTVSVTEDVPLKTVLFELARQAGVDIEIDPRISGGVLFSATRRPFHDVIDRLSMMAGLKYSFDDDMIRVSIDEPQLVTYSIPYLSLIRTTDSSIGVSTDVVTPGAAGSGGGDTASRSMVTGKASIDFFSELAANLTAILTATQPRGLDTADNSSQVTINRQSGLIAVYGTSRQQKSVKDYLNQVGTSVAAQIGIEAKVVEVSLREGFNSGIDWSALLDGKVQIDAPLNTFGQTLTNVTSFTLDENNLQAVLQAVERFGTTRTLSSPRLTVLNNQTALLKVANNAVFFEISVEREEATTTNGVSNNDSRLNVDSTIRTIPIGLVMAVQPSINLGDDTITLTLRPTITRVTDFVSDPAVQFINSEIPAGQPRVESQIPVVEVREMDSVMRLRSGQVAIMGGLMQDTGSYDDAGIPGVQRLPLIGKAFKRRNVERNTTELVILLKASILRTPQIPAADKRLLQVYTDDPRPFYTPEKGNPATQGAVNEPVITAPTPQPLHLQK